MKRFFKPVERDGSFKKPTLSSSSSPVKDSEKPTENASDAGNEENVDNAKKEPSKFLTWNANSFLLRIKNNWAEFSKFVESLDPDVIAIQEVRMPAAGSKGASKNPRELKDDTSSSREEKQVVMRALSNAPFKNYNVWWSLSDSKYAGTALLIKNCFQPKKVSFSLDQTGSRHEPDGRVIFAEFESFRLLNTYVPNNGWKDEETAFQRRRKWDKRMLEFVLKTSDKPLIWCGDLNVRCLLDYSFWIPLLMVLLPLKLLHCLNSANSWETTSFCHQDLDVSHPEFFSAAKLNGYVPPNKEDCGQPGFTVSERKRFDSILKEGKLVDAYRYLHKDKDMERGFSWSGHPVGKYRGKRMRIDYFIVSEKLKERIVACEMHGRGIELEGFYGSDHCPVSLELSYASPISSGS